MCFFHLNDPLVIKDLDRMCLVCLLISAQSLADVWLWTDNKAFWTYALCSEVREGREEMWMSDASYPMWCILELYCELVLKYSCDLESSKNRMNLNASILNL